VRIKVDEDLPPAVTERLRDAGHDAAGVVEQGMSGWKDPGLWEAVQREGRFLVTSDKGFGDIRAYPPGTHAGILVLRPDQDGIRPLVELTELVLERARLDDLARFVSVATPRGLRTRRPNPSPGAA
jgi:predicted nuclease of predicted toxin-antitoxin system